METLSQIKSLLNVSVLPLNKADEQDNKGTWWYNGITKDANGNVHSFSIPEDTVKSLQSNASIKLARSSTQMVSKNGNEYTQHRLWVMTEAKEAEVTL